MDLQGSKTGLLTCTEKMFCYSISLVKYFFYLLCNCIILNVFTYQSYLFPKIALRGLNNRAYFHSLLSTKTLPTLSQGAQVTSPPRIALINLVCNGLSHL